MINGRPAPIRGWTNGSMKCGPSAATTTCPFFGALWGSHFLIWICLEMVFLQCLPPKWQFHWDYMADFQTKHDKPISCIFLLLLPQAAVAGTCES